MPASLAMRKASLLHVSPEPPSSCPAPFQRIGLWWVWCRRVLGSGVQLMAFLLSQFAQAVHAESSSAEALEMPYAIKHRTEGVQQGNLLCSHCWAALSIAALWNCAKATSRGRQRSLLNICLCMHLLENQKSLTEAWASFLVLLSAYTAFFCWHVSMDFAKVVNGCPHLRDRENEADIHVVLLRAACASQRQNQAYEPGFCLKPLPFLWSITAFW